MASAILLPFLTDGEKVPLVMGFKLMDAEPQAFPVQADEGDVDISEEIEPADEVVGVEIPEGQITVQPSSEEEINVNGTVLKPDTGLAALRAGCAFYGLSSSGSKQRCFQRIVDHLKKVELETMMATAKAAQNEMERQPSARPSATPPSEAEQALHRLTHLPYANWCPSCFEPEGTTRQT